MPGKRCNVALAPTRFDFNVSKAIGSRSMAKSPFQPALWSPSDSPPHPANRSILVQLGLGHQTDSPSSVDQWIAPAVMINVR